MDTCSLELFFGSVNVIDHEDSFVHQQFFSVGDDVVELEKENSNER